MEMVKRLTQTELHRVLYYNPLSGNFIWRTSPSPMARVRAGDMAGRIRRVGHDRRPYRYITIHQHTYGAQRLAFLYIKGHWPDNQMDHKDGNSLNNRWLNLRECTRSQNAANSGPQKNNKLGIKGVWRRKRGKFRSGIRVYGKRINLGTFDTLEVAAHAYQRAAKMYFGEFARGNW